MPAKTLRDEELLRRLNAHPSIRSRMESLLLVVEDEGGDLKEADAAEMRVIEEIRRIGQESLEAWASRQVDKVSEELDQTTKPKGFGAKVKKLCWHTTFGDIEVNEPQYRSGSRRLWPFVQSAV